MTVKSVEYDPTKFVNIKKKDGKIIKRPADWAENNPTLLKSFGWTVVVGSVKDKPKPKTEVKPKRRKKVKDTITS